MGEKRRRIKDDELQHYEDNIAGSVRILGLLSHLFHMVTFHIADPDVRQAAQDDIRDATDSAEGIRQRSIVRMNERKGE